MLEVPQYIKVTITFVVLATFCNLLSIGGVYWFQFQDHEGNQGLWISCKDGTCYRDDDASGLRLNCQIISVLSCLSTIFGALSLITSLAFEHPRYIVAITCILTAFMLSVALLGIASKQKLEIKDKIAIYGWSFGFQCLNIIFLSSGMLVFYRFYYRIKK